MTRIIAVTGATGYIAGHIIKELLEHGHNVRAIVRDLTNKKKYEYLKQFVKNQDDKQLEFVEAKGSSIEDYAPVLIGADAVIHTATPFVVTAEDPQRDIVDPAINLTRAVILASIKSKVKRVVVTSSGGAFLNNPIPDNYTYTAKDWNESCSLTNNPYFYSKTLAEKEAWKLYEEHKSEFELVVVNPLYVFGPLLNGELNTSVKHALAYLMGYTQEVYPMSTGFVDVRDVAKAHVIAVENQQAAGQRLFCCDSVHAMEDLPKEIKRQYPQYPIGAFEFNTKAQLFSIDVEPLKKFGLTQYIGFEQMVKDTIESLIHFGLVEKK
ncbi:nucleoside-diphosphate-sugar epimerase [Naegleria gruberi]|uniref:Nucleoside-diphosphate-sugar epimerase n=1 Tax=Naegleria gruberi TaxID=5762 RepID=D2VLE8_NAEGR|nr:nucleoside-diphosphate-sugar epimerase [Naegleria gruberi]EFC42298.1 nucleoside-diphosphate-sugar epimerase [Naegleria gruberi]|eukprot:XP_002675042.1 nucleoside-diphosphate-sugar epimerase [Naegleria gruberi strain NEG-M]